MSQNFLKLWLCRHALFLHSSFGLTDSGYPPLRARNRFSRLRKLSACQALVHIFNSGRFDYRKQSLDQRSRSLGEHRSTHPELIYPSKQLSTFEGVPWPNPLYISIGSANTEKQLCEKVQFSGDPT